MKTTRTRKRGRLAALGLALLLAGVGLATAFKPDSSPARERGPGAPVVTVTHPRERKITEWDEFTGRFQAVQHVDVRARVSGYLESVHFQEGQIVHQGDLLFIIDPRPYQAAVSRAEGALAQAQSRLKLAQLDLARGERLLKKSAISREEVDKRRATLQETQAGVEVAQAELRTAQLNLGYTRITAPVTGRISSRHVDVGNLIASGASAQVLTTIVSLDPVYFVFNVSEDEYLKFERLCKQDDLSGDTGRPAQLRLLDEQGWSHKGHIDFVDNSLDPGTGTLRMRAVFPNPDGVLRPGLFGRLRLSPAGPQKALLIPDAAVVSDQASKMVLTVAADGTVKPQPVKLGPLYGRMRVVKSGLSPADQVIVQGLLRARPGSKVTPQFAVDAARVVADNAP